METLQDLQKKIAEKPGLEAKLAELQAQHREFDRNVISLTIAHRQEQEEVEKLEGRSLANYFFQVVGKLDDKLTKERQEAYAAKVKLDAAQRELTAIAADIRRIRGQLADIRIFQARYDEALKARRAALTAAATAAGERILELDQQVAVLEAQRKEIQEAIDAGLSARSTADRILGELDSADGWNTWDLWGGGGIITHMAKHEHLDAAQDLVEQLQDQLRWFKTELADVQISADLQVNIDGFLRFADYFFDGLFADWAVQERISNSQFSVQRTWNRITQALDRLKAMERSVDGQIQTLLAQVDTEILLG